jgi:cytidine deaminase
MTVDEERLIQTAKAVRKNAYAPYSGYFVGAALLDEIGRVHAGCNVENAASPEGSCAEANAIGAMVTAGGSRIVVIAIAGGLDEIDGCTPCGGCRQKITEFADAQTRVILIGKDDAVTKYAIQELLPVSFRFPD